MALTGISVLLAEDNPTNQLVAVQMLESLGATVTLASDGAEALEILDRQRFDVGLIDIEMPRVSGVELIQTVRDRDDDLADMPLIALTAYVMREHREAIEEAGADGIIAKPILSIDGFGSEILGFMKSRASGAVESSATARASSGVDRSVFDKLLASLGSTAKPEFLRRVKADMGAARGDIEAAVHRQDWPALCAATHILISIGGSIGANLVHDLARCLNSAGHGGDIAAIDRDAPVILGEIDLVLAFVTEEEVKE